MRALANYRCTNPLRHQRKTPRAIGCLWRSQFRSDCPHEREASRRPTHPTCTGHPLPAQVHRYVHIRPDSELSYMTCSSYSILQLCFLRLYRMHATTASGCAPKLSIPESPRMFTRTIIPQLTAVNFRRKHTPHPCPRQGPTADWSRSLLQLYQNHRPCHQPPVHTPSLHRAQHQLCSHIQTLSPGHMQALQQCRHQLCSRNRHLRPWHHRIPSHCN